MNIMNAFLPPHSILHLKPPSACNPTVAIYATFITDKRVRGCTPTPKKRGRGPKDEGGEK